MALVYAEVPMTDAEESVRRKFLFSYKKIKIYSF